MMVCRREGYLPDWLKSSVEWEVLGEKLAQIFIYQLLARNILLPTNIDNLNGCREKKQKDQFVKII